MERPYSPQWPSWPTLVVSLAIAITGCGSGETLPSHPSRELLILTVAGLETGITFRHQTAAPGSYFLPEIMGSGVCLIDVDQDGDLDIFFANLGNEYVPNSPTKSEPCRLFRQTSPGHFEDVTEEFRVGFCDTGMGGAVGDANNDGFPDLYLTNYGADRLLLNRGGQHFDDATDAAGIFNPQWASSASWCDIDRDGWLDLIVANYVDLTDLKCVQLSGGHQDYCAPTRFQTVSARLYHNLTGTLSDEERSKGMVKFNDISHSAGLSSKPYAALGLICGDVTGDGWPDIFVANDQSANHLWVNNRDGTFHEDAVLLGAAFDIRGAAQGSMGTAVVDLNQDHHLDLLVANLTGEGMALYLSDGHGGFSESASRSGLRQMSLAGTGFGLAAADLDDDGEVDLLAANGAVRRSDEIAATQDYWTPYRQPLQLLLGRGKQRFEATNSVPASFREALHVSRGLAVGDLDNDGDIDAVVTHIGEAPEIFWNTASKPGRAISVRVVDPQLGGRDAIGAIVTVRARNREWTQLAQPGTSYLSSHDPRLHFGLGPVESVDHVDVLWPDGSHERFSTELTSPHVTLRKGEGRTDVATQSN